MATHVATMQIFIESKQTLKAIKLNFKAHNK